MKKILTLAVLAAALWFGVNSTASAGGYDCYEGCYVVMYGDTMFSIGRHFDKDPYYLAHFNGLKNPNHLYAGQVLYIPAGGPGYPWDAGCGYDCGYDKMGWDRDGGYDKMGWNRDGGYQDKCDYDCGYDEMDWGPKKPMGHDKMSWGPKKPMGHDKMDWGKKPGHCGDDCGGYYGYDYSGYYYGSYYPHKQYSYTCGYYSNCY
jgi:LysM repeat protein